MKEFEKIIGYEAIKKELAQIADVLKNADAYKKLGVTPPRGLLLHGKPGVGKTLMATALIRASRRKTVVCRKDKPNGDFVKAIKKAFRDAEEAAPAIVFLDDMDKFANGDERHPDAEEYVTVQSCIDEIRDKDVFVLATANRIRALPESLLRAGRFDRVIKVRNPRGRDAERIIDHYIKQKKFVGDMDPVIVARMMDGRSCAELETVINEAGLYAGYERSDVITMEHFMRACLHTVHNVPLEVLEAEPVPVDLTDGTDPQAQTIYHEAGHATVAEAINPGSVTLISAYSRHGESGGFTACWSEAPRGSGRFVYGHVCNSLGGLAATEQVFGVRDLGSSEDLDKAFACIKDLVGDNCVCGFPLHSYGDYDNSEALKTRLEQTTAAELEHWYCKTKEILSVNRAFLDALARALAEKGILTAADIAEIRAAHPTLPVAV